MYHINFIASVKKTLYFPQFSNIKLDIMYK